LILDPPGDGGEPTLDATVRRCMSLAIVLAVLAIIADGRLRVKSQVGMPEPWASDPGVPLPHAHCSPRTLNATR